MISGRDRGAGGVGRGVDNRIDNGTRESFPVVSLRAPISKPSTTTTLSSVDSSKVERSAVVFRLRGPLGPFLGTSQLKPNAVNSARTLGCRSNRSGCRRSPYNIEPFTTGNVCDMLHMSKGVVCDMPQISSLLQGGSRTTEVSLH